MDSESEIAFWGWLRRQMLMIRKDMQPLMMRILFSKAPDMLSQSKALYILDVSVVDLNKKMHLECTNLTAEGHKDSASMRPNAPRYLLRTTRPSLSFAATHCDLL